MEPRIQEASEEMLDLLRADGLEITWWMQPHRSEGWVKSLFVLVEEDEGVIVVGERQSLEHLRGRDRVETDDSFDHARADVDAGAIPPILDVLATTTLPWRRSIEPVPSFGGSHYGLRVEWAGFETERRWEGRLEDADEVTLRLWNLVDALVRSP